MKKIGIFLLIFVTACSSTQRRTAATTPAQALPPVPADALSLDQALKLGSNSTLVYLKSHSTAKAFEGIEAQDPATVLPLSLKGAAPASDVDHDKIVRLTYLRKFKPWGINRKSKRAEQLLAGFQCGDALETQALAMSFERDFPAEAASQFSESLHEKVISCSGDFKQESLFRLSVFAIQKDHCPKALGYLKQFPPTPESGINDRVTYLQNLCLQTKGSVQARNPWGGYGIRLTDVQATTAEKPLWVLTTASGVEEWDRLLVSLVELSQKNELGKVRYLATKLNYEKFRTLPHPFQASLLTVLHFASADLSVFQTLHRYLSDHPNLINREVAGLLFPVRYWQEILENSTGADPVLVKSLIRQESAFNPGARSRARAIGLMQLIYPTARIFGVKSKKQLLVPKENIRAGSEFLGRLIQKFGSVELALAAYNAGPLLVQDWKKRYPTDNIDLFVEMIPYTETREYVRLVTRNYKIYQTLLLQHQGTQTGMAQALPNPQD